MFAFITVLYTLYCLRVSVQYMYLLFYCLYSGQSSSRTNRPHLCSLTACIWLYFSRLHIYFKYFFLLNGVHFALWAALLFMKLNVFILIRSSVFFIQSQAATRSPVQFCMGNVSVGHWKSTRTCSRAHTHTLYLSLDKQNHCENMWQWQNGCLALHVKPLVWRRIYSVCVCRWSRWARDGGSGWSFCSYRQKERPRLFTGRLNSYYTILSVDQFSATTT